MVPEATREDLHLHGLPHGAGNRVKTCTYQVCHMVPEQKTCSYTVCHMVPEQRVKQCQYTVCHMVPETTPRPAPTRSATWCRRLA